MSKSKKSSFAWITLLLALLVGMTVIIVVVLNSGGSNDIVVSGGGEVIGLKCENETLTHPVLTHLKPASFKNEISANFQNDKLMSIMYHYDGTYGSTKEVDEVEAFAAADYNTILAKDYGEDIDVFSHVFMKDGNKLKLTINAKANKVNSKVAPYFLLSQNESFPRTLGAMKKAYENAGFSCDKTK